MGIIIPDTEYADAEIWVKTIDKPFFEDETGHLLTIIPFRMGGWQSDDKFRENVFKVADTLEETYQHYPDAIGIEVKFKNPYVNC
jgi:hypothetical protein